MTALFSHVEVEHPLRRTSGSTRLAWLPPPWTGIEGDDMGGKPSKGTPADRRLTANKPATPVAKKATPPAAKTMPKKSC